MKAIAYTLAIFILYSAGPEEQTILSKAEEDKRIQVRRIYTAELGIKEKTGKNDGPRVEEYLRHASLERGDPWCAAFVCWVFDKAGVDNPRTGWSPDLFPKERLVWERKKAAVAGRKAVKNLPKNGDVFGIWFPEKGRIAHAGFVDKWSDTWLITVEGNTNEAASREGDGVYRKRRLVRTVYQVSQFVDEKMTNQKISK